MRKALRPEPARHTPAVDCYDEIAENLKRIRSEVVLPCDVEPIALGTSRIACSRCAARGDWRGSLCNACAHYEPAAMTFTPAKGAPIAVSRAVSFYQRTLAYEDDWVQKAFDAYFGPVADEDGA